MAIRINGGGGGGGAAAVPVPGTHPDTGEVLYTLDAGSVANTGAGTYSDLTGTVSQAPGHNSDVDSHLCEDGELTVNVNGTNIRNNTAITVAAWVYVTANPAGNTAIAGIRNSGAGSAYNFAWTFDHQTDGYLRFMWQSGTKDNQTVGGNVASDLPKNQWVHVMATRTADGTAGSIWINGVETESATGLTQALLGANNVTLRLGSNGTDLLQGYMGNVYIDDSYTSDGLAFYEAAKQAAA